MPSRVLPYPVFDADNHFYEPKEALTQFLPEHRKGHPPPAIGGSSRE